MFYLFIWWALLILIGFAATPVAFQFFAHLPERGYALAKPLGLLLFAYPFWLLTSFGLVENTFGAIALTIIIVAALAWGATWWRRESGELRSWLRENSRYLIAVELIFTIAFFAFAYYRSFNPEITATEKPMEFMFLNSILRSAQFPPHDSWLSGYAISYYYLGYVIVASLSKLTAVPSNFAFNLGLTMVFALSATGAFGLTYNLVKGAREADADERPRKQQPRVERAPYITGILAVFLLLIIGNFEGLFESLHNARIGSSEFYVSLDVNGLADAPTSGSFVPQDNWWWWRASRVVNDHNPTNREHIEVIDEFPAFSFLLGDLHPHVLALPFDFLALAVAFNFLRKSRTEGGSLYNTLLQWLTPGMLLTAVILGSLGMLNTWDLVTYGFIIIAAFAIAESRAAGHWSRAVFARTVLFGAVLLVASYLLFLPFYMGFSSQVQGIAPAVFFKTPLHQYLMMFGLFVFVLVSFVGVLFWQRRESLSPVLREAASWALLILSMPVAIGVVGLVVLARSIELRSQVAALLNAPNPNEVMSEVLGAYVRTLLSNPGVFLLLTLLLAGIIALVRVPPLVETNPGGAGHSVDTSVTFVLLLAFTGFLLTLGVEFLYVRDVFGSRMNTVFKLYFQAWTLLSASAAFGAYYVWLNTRGAARSLWAGAFGALFALSLVYPMLAFPNRANDFKPNAAAGIPTLDGTLWIRNSNPDDYAAIQWLNSNAADQAVILEAPGPQYSFYDRVSVATGLETVLGWGGHELQWRGNGDETGKRESDVEMIYKAMDSNQARVLLHKYGVDYVIVGGIEREKYALTRPMVDKFAKFGQLVFNQGSMQIFQVNQ
jgi:YYY domain-containing protein